MLSNLNLRPNLKDLTDKIKKSERIFYYNDYMALKNKQIDRVMFFYMEPRKFQLYLEKSNQTETSTVRCSLQEFLTLVGKKTEGYYAQRLAELEAMTRFAMVAFGLFLAYNLTSIFINTQGNYILK